jgi:hypothetical protein
MNWQYWLQRVAYNLGLGGGLRYLFGGIASAVVLVIVLIFAVA